MTEATDLPQSRPARRMNWLDTVRGIALIAMATYHLMWDLDYFRYLEPGFASGPWPRMYAYAISSTFLFLAGFSLVLAHGRGIRWGSFWRRWLMVVGGGVLVTVATYVLMPQNFVYFGILQAIAAASLVGLLFLRLPWIVTFAVAALVLVAPQYLRSDAFNQPWLWWIGLSTAPRPSFDFVPLLPRLAPFLVGIGIGSIAPLVTWLRQKASGDKSQNFISRTFSFLGRHSLVFYIVHQPVLISIVYGASLIYPAPGHPEAFVRSCVASCVPDASEAFCKRYCDCALMGLEGQNLLQPLQSGTIPDAYRGEIDKIRSQCTFEAEPALDETGN